MLAIYLTEFIGTFFLVLTVGLTVVHGAPFTPLAIASALMVMVYMGGHVSGAHYNPAVTLAVWLRGKLAGGRVLPYMIAQVAGALTAAVVVTVVTGETFGPARGPGVSTSVALLLEALCTFALALVVLNAATAPRTDGNSFYGLAIGFTVFAVGVAATPTSGGAFNPAVGIGSLVVQAIVGDGALGDLWIYLVGPFAGGAVAAAVYRLQNPESPRAAESVAATARAGVRWGLACGPARGTERGSERGRRPPARCWGRDRQGGRDVRDVARIEPVHDEAGRRHSPQSPRARDGGGDRGGRHHGAAVTGRRSGLADVDAERGAAVGAGAARA